ncbi:MAG: tellurite-like stress resistance cysteine protease StiP [Deinococcus sp.]|nr:tellurite-like stress resistance cysteine protease StiP [Deinococcus sp.]
MTAAGANQAAQHTLPAQDVSVLLDIVSPGSPGVQLVSIEEKERLIRSGQSYGELLTPESQPSDLQRETFARSLQRGGPRVAELLVRLAGTLYHQYGHRAVLVSLARAGTPVGCALRRLARRWGVDWPHFTVSIIRGVGLDPVALAQIQRAYPDRPLVFVDGWTGKGSIYAALRDSLPQGCPPHLAVLSDPAGVATHAATFEDLLLPHAALNATVCGLLSRTLLPAAEGERHRALVETGLRSADQTEDYLSALDTLTAGHTSPPAASPTPGTRPMRPFGAVWALAQALGVRDPHLVKPSVGEATRVFLRRQPAGLWVRDQRSPEVAHLLLMAGAAGVPVTEVPALPYQAAALIAQGHRE